MDRKSKVNSRSDKPANGEKNTKEEALEKLRQMEWVRNKQDSWHLSRPNPRNEATREKKKYNKNFESDPGTGACREKKKYDETNYFDGTSGNQKNKRYRKPRDTPVQPSVSTSFSFTPAEGPPPVNAWSQKKGSDLFSKPPEELDLEEDEMLKLALQESLRTAELDKMRNLERMKLYGAKDFYTGEDFAEKDMEDDLEDEEDNNYVSPPLPQFNKISNKKSDLHFIDTSSTEDLNTSSDQRRRLPPRCRKSSSPQENVSEMEVSNKVYPSVKNIKKEGHPAQGEFNNDIFEPSRPIASSKNKFYHDAYKPRRAQEESSSMMELKSPIVISEKYDDPTIIDNLSANLNSTLTFDNTKGFLDNLQLDGHHYKSQPAAQIFPINSSVYEPEKTVHVGLTTNLKDSSTSNLPSSSPSETDILIHQFIKHEPPSSLAPNISFQETERPAEIFSLNASQQYFSPNSLQEKEGQSVLNFFNSIGQSQPISIDKNGQSSNSSVSNSPLQNDSLYGSLDKHNAMHPTGILHTQPQSGPFLPLGPGNVQNQGMPIKLHEAQLASHLASLALYPNYSPSIMTRAAHPGLHLNTTMPSISPYHLHNSNLMMPLSFPGQDLLNSLNQSPQTAQYYQQQLMLMQLQQYQQAQRAAHNMNDTENSESLLKEQQPSIFGQLPPQLIKNTNQPTMNTTENQSQFLAQNLSPHQPQMINLQNQHLHLNQQTQPQVVPKPDIPLTLQDGLPAQYQLPNPEKHRFQPVAPTKEDMIMQFHKAELMHHMRQPDIPLTQQDGLPGQYQLPNSGEQRFQPVAPTKEDMIMQFHKAELMEHMRHPDIPLTQQDGLPGQCQLPNSGEQRFQPVAPTKEDMIMQYQKAELMHHMRQPDIPLTQQDGLPGQCQLPKPAEQKFQPVSPTKEDMIMQYHKAGLMHHMRQPDIPLTQQDGSPGQCQLPNSGEQRFRPVSPTKEEMFRQQYYHQMEQQYNNIHYMRQQLLAAGALGQPQAMSVPHPLLIPTHPTAMGSNSYYAQSLQAMPQSQPLPVQLAENTGQLSPNKQDTSVPSEMFDMIPDSYIQTPLQPKIGRGRGRLN